MAHRLIIAALVLLSACQSAPPTPAATLQPTASSVPAAILPEEILYHTPDGTLSAVDSNTGTVRVIAGDLNDLTGEDLDMAKLPVPSPDGTLLAFEGIVTIERDNGFTRINNGIWTVGVDGSNLKQLTVPDENESHSNPVWSPDGGIAFHNILPDLAQSQWLSVESATGDINPLLPQGIRASALSWSADGTKIAYMEPWRNEDSLFPNRLVIYDLATGTETEVFKVGHQSVTAFDWSPDGTQFAAAILDFETQLTEIFVMDAGGSNLTNLTPGQKYSYQPNFSPDGTHIAAANNDENGVPAIFIYNLAVPQEGWVKLVNTAAREMRW